MEQEATEGSERNCFPPFSPMLLLKLRVPRFMDRKFASRSRWQPTRFTSERRFASFSLLAGVVVPPARLRAHEPSATEKDRDDRVQYDRRPQQEARPIRRECRVQREMPWPARCRSTCRRALSGQASRRRPRRSRRCRVTRATGMATPESSAPSNSRPTSDGTTSNANPVAASLTAARRSTFFIESVSGPCALSIWFAMAGSG